MTLFTNATPNEKLLLSILAAIVFIGANYFGYHWLSLKQASLDHAYAELRADQAEAKVDLLESDKWAQRRAWLHDHEPKLTDEGDAKAQVLAYALKGARDNKLEIVDQSLLDVEHNAAGTCVNVSVKVKGSMENMVKWLAPLQTPDQFYAVSVKELKADQDQKSMVCTLQISRYFQAP